MSDIYMHAELTIIATAGDAHHGLPGVNGVARSSTRQLHLGDRILQERYNFETEILASEWAKRAWTYQEGALSRRRLFFTDLGVVFWCKPLYCQEDIRYDRSTKYYYSPIPDAISRAVPIHWAGEKRATSQSVISHYSNKRMSYETDALKACLGLLKALETTHYWGVQISTQEHPTCSGLPMELLWYSEGSHERNTFPSWSWTRWSGWVYFRKEGGPTPYSIRNIEIQLQDASWINIEGSVHLPRGNLSDVSPGHTLRVTGKVSSPQFFATDAGVHIKIQSLSGDKINLTTWLDDSTLRRTSNLLHELHGAIALEVEELHVFHVRGSESDLEFKYMRGTFLLLREERGAYRRLGIAGSYDMSYDGGDWGKQHTPIVCETINRLDAGRIDLADSSVRTIYLI
jgi:hypothetical protein